MSKSSIIRENILKFLDDEQNHSVSEIKKYIQEMGVSDYTEGQFAGVLNTLVRNGSIEKKDRGVYSIRTRSGMMKKCFVVSPIGDEGSVTRSNADKLYKYIIKPVCETCDFEAVRVDQLNDANSITQTIIELLDEADLVIADITEHNPNVFYEIGYRTRTKRPIIHLKAKSERLPFDINTIRTFEYDLTDLDSVEEIKERLTQTVKSFDFSSYEETGDEEGENTFSSIMPVLYQILDAIAALKKEH